jgi:hypothetical protein
MVVVERIEYQLTEEILDEAAAAVVREYVPKVQPYHSPEMILKLLALAGFCLALLVVGVVFEMSTEHYVITGLGVASCLFAAAAPWMCRSINNGLTRFTRYAQRRVRDHLDKACAPAIGSTVRWEFDEEGFRAQMLDNTRRFAWTELKQVRTRSIFWMLKMKSDELLLPIAPMTDAVRELILRKIREVGVKFVEA